MQGPVSRELRCRPYEREKPFYPLTGMLRQNSASDVDFVGLMENSGYHTGIDATICESEKWIMTRVGTYPNM